MTYSAARLNRLRVLRRSVRATAADNKVNVLLIGGGGREHALAWKLSQSPMCGKLFCAPGNPGVAEETGVEIAKDVSDADHQGVASFCKTKDVDFVFVGPEAPLVDGLIDSLTAEGISAFGPSRAAAQLEGSKRFMKDLCEKYGIPTAFYKAFTTLDAATAFIKERGAPIVIKASGLAAGKGVIIAHTVDEAIEAAAGMLEGGTFGAAGSEIIVEEFLDGEEVSYFALIDGSSILPLASAQDHKAAYDGDKGPNTGGMGAYTPAPVLTPDLEQQVVETIVQRTADAMVAEGAPFRGVLFAGLMIKDGQAKLLEHNVRFGDPECQGLMMRLESDLLEVLLAAAHGNMASCGELSWSSSSAVTVVYAAKGYPGAYTKGTVIKGLDDVGDSAKVFHAGTARNDDGQLVAAGGRVLGITALGSDVKDAQAKAYEAVDRIDWSEGFHRTDIGWRAVARLKRQRHLLGEQHGSPLSLLPTCTLCM
eukprot:TRINITY_DN28022_c0_g1_i4.p1 TRINITY_DN28022_c0_g1~~TRINITY_DN28022_c0_g1_i4.p1  ORF type:complete len:479 (-),score=81.16 TRINITY_DN28022_c0_g1_i4:114-1550(-)